MYAAENYKGYTVKTSPDGDPINPRVDYDNLGVIYTNAPRSFNPDGKDIDDLFEEAGIDPLDIDNVIPWSKLGKKFIYLKIWIYDHSGIALATGDSNPFSCPFDSGLGGVIAVSKEKVRKEYSCKGRSISPRVKQIVESVLVGEIEELSHYLNGEIYCVTVENPKGEEEYSCCGFLSEEEAISDGKDYVDSVIKE